MSGDSLERGDSRTTTMLAVTDDSLDFACCVYVAGGLFGLCHVVQRLEVQEHGTDVHGPVVSASRRVCLASHLSLEPLHFTTYIVNLPSAQLGALNLALFGLAVRMK